MFNFLGRALSGLVLTKSARDAVDRARGVPAIQNARDNTAAALAAMQTQAKELVTPEGAVRLHNVVKIRAARKVIVDTLSDPQRAKLVGAAMKRLLKEDKK